MQLYHLTNLLPGHPVAPGDAVSTFAGTRDEAKTLLKSHLAIYRAGFVVELVNVPNDKEAMVNILNGERGFDVLKRWRGTARGGLREINADGSYVSTVETVEEAS